MLSNLILAIVISFNAMMMFEGINQLNTVVVTPDLKVRIIRLGATLLTTFMFLHIRSMLRKIGKDLKSINKSMKSIQNSEK